MKLEHKHHYLMTGVPMGVILALEWLMDALRSENLIPDGRDVLNRVYWTNKAVFATDGYRLHVLNTRGILNGATARIEHGWYDMDIKRALAAPPQRGVAVLDSLYAWQAVTRFDRAVKVYVPGGGAPVSVSGTIHNIDALAVIMPMAGGVMRDAEED